MRHLSGVASAPRFFENGLTPKNRGADAAPLRNVSLEAARGLTRSGQRDDKTGSANLCSAATVIGIDLNAGVRERGSDDLGTRTLHSG